MTTLTQGARNTDWEALEVAACSRSVKGGDWDRREKVVILHIGKVVILHIGKGVILHIGKVVILHIGKVVILHTGSVRTRVS